jgi:hypothetical protein
MEHLYSLSTFVDSEVGPAINERESWYESTMVSHEKAKNLYVPRIDEDHLFNSFNGGRTLGPLQDSRASTNIRRPAPQGGMEALSSRSCGGTLDPSSSETRRSRHVPRDLSPPGLLRSRSRSPGPRVESS